MRNFDNEKIFLDSVRGFIRCEKLSGNRYHIYNDKNVRVYDTAEYDLVELFWEQQDLCRAGHYEVRRSERLLETALRLGEKYLVVNAGGNSMQLFLRDNVVSGYIDLELHGEGLVRDYFRDNGGFDIDKINPKYKYHNRQERGSRDWSWEPFMFWSHREDAAQFYPLVIMPDGKVGAGRRFKEPIGRLQKNGLIVCGYQKFPIEILKAGGSWLRYENAENEAAYGDGYRNYGSASPIFA